MHALASLAAVFGALCLLAALAVLGLAVQRRAARASAYLEGRLSRSVAPSGTALDDAIEAHAAAAGLPLPAPLAAILLRAGLGERQKLVFAYALAALALSLAAALLIGPVLALPVLLSALALGGFTVWQLTRRRATRIVRQIPGFVDALVRQMNIGTSLGSAFQHSAQQTELPLGELLQRVARLAQAGVELDHALRQTARLYRVDVLSILGSVIGVALRFGGRSDQVLERIGAFLRDLEQARDELHALSAETRLSAWILALLPLCIATFIIVYNTRVFVDMWDDPAGRAMLLGALTLQAFGCLLLYRLARSL